MTDLNITMSQEEAERLRSVIKSRVALFVLHAHHDGGFQDSIDKAINRVIELMVREAIENDPSIKASIVQSVSNAFTPKLIASIGEKVAARVLNAAG